MILVDEIGGDKPCQNKINLIIFYYIKKLMISIRIFVVMIIVLNIFYLAIFITFWVDFFSLFF